MRVVGLVEVAQQSGRRRFTKEPVQNERGRHTALGGKLAVRGGASPARETPGMAESELAQAWRINNAVNYLLLEVGQGGLPHAEVVASLERFAKHVMPDFTDGVASA